MTKALLEIKNIIHDHQTDKNNLYKRNLIRSYLQVMILRFIYSDKNYSDLVFYGGSVLSQCYDLPRLSEDLDFVDLKGKMDFRSLASDIKNYFEKEIGLSLTIKIQKFRIYLKFPILKQLNMAENTQSDLLYLKIEIFTGTNFCKKYKIDIKPLFKYNQSILIKTFDLPTLMATKIGAVLNRKWEKIDKKGKVIINVKGRDYFDLIWYLQNKIKPNLDCVKEVKNTEELKSKLLDIVNKINDRSIILDLENFIADREFVKKLGKNIKEILRTEINGLN